MEEKKKQGQAQEKLSYDQLKQMASDLYQQNQQLHAQLKNFDVTSFFLSMLFKVMDHADKYDFQFVEWSKKNIQNTLTSFVDSLMGEEEGEKKDEDK